MTKKTKVFFALAAAFTISYQTAAFANSGVSVYINEEKVEFAGAEPIIENGRTLAPARAVFESAGAVVSWDSGSKTVKIEYGGKTIELVINSRQAKYTTSEGTKYIESDAPPKIINGSTFVPLSIIAENLGADISWDSQTRTAKLAFPKSESVLPVKENSSQGAAVSQKIHLNGLRLALDYDLMAGKKLSLGDTVEKIKANLEEFEFQSESVYGYAWQEHNIGKGNYFMTGVNAGKITAFFSNSKEIPVAGISAGMSAEALKKTLGVDIADENKTVVLTDEGTLTIFRSPLEEYSVIAVLAQKSGFTTETQITNSFFSESTERQLLNIINTERVNRGVGVLRKDETLAKLARNHSLDMAENNYLSSVDKNGDNALERAEKANLNDYIMLSENVGRGSADAIGMFSMWMSDRTSLANIVDSHYNYAGTGAAPGLNSHKMYFTMKFLER